MQRGGHSSGRGIYGAPMISKRSNRLFQAGLALMTTFVLAMSFYFQYVKGMAPCPLCLAQRYCLLILLMLGLSGLCLNTVKRGRRVAMLQSLVAAVGLFFAGRQLWLQSSLSDAPAACMPALDVLLKYMPWQEILRAFFWGAGECAEVSWTWMGLSMAAWSAIYFLIMMIASFVLYRLESR